MNSCSENSALYSSVDSGNGNSRSENSASLNAHLIFVRQCVTKLTNPGELMRKTF